MKKLLLLIIVVLNSILVLGIEANTNSGSIDEGFTNNGTFFPEVILPETEEMPQIPLSPAVPTTGKDIDEYGQIRMLEKTYTVMLESKVNVFVPLEVITDIEIEGTVIGDQIVDIPFEIELNRTPEKKDYYTVKYSENIIDIDRNGKPDTYIYSPYYINDRVSKDNLVRIYGDNISKDGNYKKDIYITIEVGN